MKFKYADVVEVTEGFYEGQKGVVSTHNPIYSAFLNKLISYEYGIELEDNYIVVPEKHLKLLKREENNGSSKPN